MNLRSPRFHFILVVLVTLFLLVGSTLLQQLVFKADQEAATLAVLPTTFRTTEGSVVDFDIQNLSADTVFATGLQVELALDATKLEFAEALPRSGWRTLVLEQSPGAIYWLLAPETTQPTITELGNDASLGRIRFRALASGSTSVSLNQKGTILAAVDPAQGNFVYNAAFGVQNSAGTIAASGEVNLEFPETAVETLTAPESTNEPLFGAQRITSVYSAATSRDVLVFVTLAYPGRASIEFGRTPRFGNSVESVTENTNHVLRLASLESGQQYYYRVIGEQAGEQSRVVGVTRSIDLPAPSTSQVLSARETEVIAFPNKTKQQSSLYVFPRDESGAAVASADLTLTASEQISVAPAKKQAGYWEFDVTGAVGRKEVVSLRPQLADQTLLTSASVVFDPNYTSSAHAPSVQELVLAWNQKTMGFMFGAAILLFLLGFLFVRLVRSR
jgi:hypothetical protein